MAPLLVLIIVTILARVGGQLGVHTLKDWSLATRVGLAVMFCFTAAAHFNSMCGDLIRMVPASVPYPELMVTFTGVCEILGAVGLLVPRTRRVSALALILFLIAVLPANIYAAQAELTLRGSPVTPLIPRVALQALFILLVGWSGIYSGRQPIAAKEIA